MDKQREVSRLASAARGLAYELEDRIRATGHEGTAVELQLEALRYADKGMGGYALRLVAWGHAWIDSGGAERARTVWEDCVYRLSVEGVEVREPWDPPLERLYGAQLRARQERERKASRLPEGPPIEADETEEPAWRSPWA